MAERKCPSCGSAELEPGSIRPIVLYFRPAGAKRFTLKPTEVRLSASLCTDCGVVTLVGDLV